MHITNWKVGGLVVLTHMFFMVTGAAAQPSPADTIYLGNPSFEDTPRAGGAGFLRPILGWIDCGKTRFPDETPPDIHPHPAAWQVQKQPHDGDTYLGIVVRDNESWESLSQAVSAPLKAGECYAFSAWLCRSDTYLSRRSQGGDSLYPFTRPAVLRIFGGNGFCEEGELLAESKPVVSDNWERHTFKFEPLSDHRYITIQVFYKTPVLVPYNGHVLVDDLSEIIRIPCSVQNLAEVFDQEEEAVPVNRKPPVVTGRTGTTTTSPPRPPTALPPPAKTETNDGPRLLTELDREKLHQGKTIRIERLYFKADSTRIGPESYPVLDEIAQFLKMNKDIVIEIGGHTNTLPSADFCNKLSTTRAKSVTEYLAQKGVAKGQLQYKGYGKTKPIVPNDTYSRSARAKNQRVEIKVLSLG
jgi:outer membrane protein OmpA-like peptidoglycan-associated protein